MKVSAKYIRSLDVYLEWEHVTTPATGSFQEATKPIAPITVSDEGVSAAEALCLWESRGKDSTVSPSESELLNRYLQGKSQRDWWTKEIGWWSKYAVLIPEEFLRHLGPLPFIDVFGRAPITRIVRLIFDNNYRIWEFNLDNFMLQKVNEWRMSYYDRNDRESAIRNAYRMVRLKWIEPSIYRMKHRIRECFESLVTR